MTAEPPLVHLCVSVGADVVERIPAFFGMAKQKGTFVHLHYAHLAFRQVCGGYYTPETNIAHVVNSPSVRARAHSRDLYRAVVTMQSHSCRAPPLSNIYGAGHHRTLRHFHLTPDKCLA
jgi:hypothetical protein